MHYTVLPIYDDIDTYCSPSNSLYLSRETTFFPLLVPSFNLHRVMGII